MPTEYLLYSESSHVNENEGQVPGSVPAASASRADLPGSPLTLHVKDILSLTYLHNKSL